MTEEYSQSQPSWIPSDEQGKEEIKETPQNDKNNEDHINQTGASIRIDNRDKCLYMDPVCLGDEDQVVIVPEINVPKELVFSYWPVLLLVSGFIPGFLILPLMLIPGFMFTAPIVGFAISFITHGVGFAGWKDSKNRKTQLFAQACGFSCLFDITVSLTFSLFVFTTIVTVILFLCLLCCMVCCVFLFTLIGVLACRT